jgi:hypothetical protein
MLSVVVFENGVVARSTYVKELICSSLLLQIDLVRVSQTFGRHIERWVSGVVDFLEKPSRILSEYSSSKQGSTKQIEETEEPKKQHLSTRATLPPLTTNAVMQPTSIK